MTLRRIVIGIVLALIVVCVIIIILDWHDVRRVLREANWRLLLPAFLFTVASYLCLSYGLAAVFRIFGIRMGHRDLLEIGFVSNVLNYLLSIGGAVGISLRFVLMKRRGLATEDILAPSVFHSYFNNLALFSLLPIGLFHILVSHPLSPGGSFGIGIAGGVLSLVLIFATAIVFVAPARSYLFRGLRRAWRFITKRDIEAALNDFDTALARGVAVIRQRPLVLALPLVLIIGDWVSSVAALWFCFTALGNPVGVGTLLTGFGIGVTVGLLSLVPGGLGIQEGSMAGIYALLGVPLEQAVLAAILFRFVYYFIPFFISLGFYRRLLLSKPG